MKRLFTIISMALAVFTAKGQLAGTYSVPATFSTIGAAVNALNTQGISGTVTILVSAGHTETASVGGYSLTTTGTATAPIIFQKSGAGANPVIFAYGGGSGTPASAAQDGVLRLIGSDFITIDGINITDNNVSNPSTMEFGYGLFKASAADGCQNNTIRNCVISLNRINNALGSGPAADGSRGIDVVNATSQAHTSAVSVTAAAGSNSNNRFYSNTIQNCNIGIALIGFADASPFTFADTGNDVGGNSTLTGNTIIDYGGGATTSPAAGVRTLAQYELNISYNTVDNNTGAGVNHGSTLRGIYLNTATSANATISNNTVTIRGGGTTQQLSAIENSSGSTAASNTISITNNLVTNCTYATATSGAFYGIFNSGASPALLHIASNTVAGNSTGGTSGLYYNIYSTGATGSSNFINNSIGNNSLTAGATSASYRGIVNTTGASGSTVTISSNTFMSVSYAGTASGLFSFIYNFAPVAAGMNIISNNTASNFTVPTSAISYLYYNNSSTQNNLVSGNSVINFTKSGASGALYGYYNAGAPAGGSATVTANTFSNMTVSGTSAFYGIYHATSVSQNASIVSNTITNLNGGTGTLYGTYFADGNTVEIQNNIIRNLSGGGTVYGLQIGTTASQSLDVAGNALHSYTSTGASPVYGYIQSSGNIINMYKNKIYDLVSNNAAGTVAGIYITGATTSNIYNNLIGDLHAPVADAANPVNGIFINAGTTVNLYYNTVRLNTSSSGTNFGSSAVYAITTPNVYFRNNIFINLSTPSGSGLTAAHRRSSATLATYSVSSDDNLYHAGAPGASNVIYTDGTNTYSTLALYKAFASPRDAASITENTTFLSLVGGNANFLHVDPASLSITESAGTNISGITDDYDGDIRHGNPGYVGGGTAPDIGADEYTSVLPNCNAVNATTLSPVSATRCVGQTHTMLGSGATLAAGIVHQWQVASIPGGPYSNVVGGQGGNTTSYTTPTLGLGTYYYVLVTTCTISNQSATSNEATVTVSAYPSVSVTPTVALICNPGGSSVTLTGSGANSYTWSPAAGLSGTTGVSVNAFPLGSTAYLVTGANLAGCTGTAVAYVNVAQAPSIQSISATPTLICPGGTSSLLAAGNSTSYAISAIPFAPVPTPTAGEVILANNGVAVTPLSGGSLDDGGWANQPIGFAFNLFATPYTSFAVSTNGFIYLGTGNPNTWSGYNVAFPSLTPARPSIGAIYGDLQFNQGGTISHFTTGVSPNRRLIVNWTNGKFFTGGGTGTVNVQAILHETSDVIEVHTYQTTGNANVVQGILNQTGTQAHVVLGRNAQLFTVTPTQPDAYRWTPPGPVTYSWSPSTYLNASNISNPVASSVTTAIVYTVDVTAPNGCISSPTIDITLDTAPTVAISGGTAAVCPGTTLNLLASGADTYSWSNGSTSSSISPAPLSSTSYSVIGTLSVNGCTTVAVQNVTVNPNPTVSVSGPTAICLGDQATLISGGANSYSWSTGSTLNVIAVTPSSNFTYNVIGTSNEGCTGSASGTVIVNALPSVTISASPSSTICEGESVQLIASAFGADTYSWSNGGNFPIMTVSPAVSSNYTVTVGNNSTGCSNSTTFSVTVRTCVGLKENAAASDGISIYPNPTHDRFQLLTNSVDDKTFELLDVSGRVIASGRSSDATIQMDLASYAKGLYYVKLSTTQRTYMLKVIKN